MNPLKSILKDHSRAEEGGDVTRSRWYVGLSISIHFKMLTLVDGIASGRGA